MSTTQNAERMEALYLKYQPLVHRIFARRVNDPELARDLTQETFLRAWRTNDRFDESRSAWPWLSTIVHRVLIDEVMRKKGSSSVRADARFCQEEFIRALPKGQVAPIIPDLDEKWACLTSRERQALLMHHVFGLDRREVAEVVGLSTKGADTLLMRAKRALRAALEAQQAITSSTESSQESTQRSKTTSHTSV